MGAFAGAVPKQLSGWLGLELETPRSEPSCLFQSVPPQSSPHRRRQTLRRLHREERAPVAAGRQHDGNPETESALSEFPNVATCGQWNGLSSVG